MEGQRIFEEDITLHDLGPPKASSDTERVFLPQVTGVAEGGW